MGVVTISRKYGAGGHRVAVILAVELGFTLADRELVEDAARRLGVEPEVARGWDERAPALIEELGLALAAGTPMVTEGMVSLPGGVPSDNALAEATRRVIVSLAERGGFVILGRGGQCALHERADAAHLLLVGDLTDRLRRIMDLQSVGEAEARSRCERADAARAGYVRRYYGRNIDDPHLYDAILNTSRMNIEEAASIAVEIARRRLGPA